MDESGEWDGEVVAPIFQHPGSFTIDVTATGDWELVLKQPQPDAGEPVPQTLSGSGKEVRGPYAFEGEYTISGTYDGSEVFAVVLYDNSGDAKDVFNYSDGEFQHDRTPDLSVDAGWISVYANRDWSLAIE